MNRTTAFLYRVKVSFPDGSKREHPCANKRVAKDTFIQACSNPAVQRTGATVAVIDANGFVVELL